MENAEYIVYAEKRSVEEIREMFGIENRSDLVNPEIENKFTYHPPKEGQPQRYEDIRNWAKSLAYALDANCPDSREKSLAITKLEEVVFWANAAIARNE